LEYGNEKRNGRTIKVMLTQRSVKMFQKLNKIKLLFLTFIIALICTGCGVYVTTQNSGQEGNQESAYKEEATVETVTEADS